ncbi:TPA: hypothetical protein DCL30_02230 [Candidatus Peribacteria bacterium]|nr:MAG: hypothetical protein A3J91_04070 [Candidatus Peribacteria bacterium RIFOXYC2_FULL_58_10]HAI98343.1 hypothetical protein [Candidatus Peribacteria bacterium]HAS33764.1 hypothetical protein [Candidatus Peribacteria bacterium]
MMLHAPIHHTFAPHVTFRTVLRSLALILTPFRWKRGAAVESLRHALADTFHAEAFLFSSGREALLALLKALDLRAGEEVIIQGYTCVVLPNAIHATGAVTVYVDIDYHSLNMSVDAVEHAFTPRTRAVICQHTFGIPSDVSALRELCDRHHAVLIEDCAHVMPDPSGPSAISSRGDFILFSFGRDKAISGITGGAILSRKSDVSKRLKEEEDRATDLSSLRIARLLAYPATYFTARLLFAVGLGRIFLKCAQLLGLLVPILRREEKRGYMSPLLTRLPNACAALALDSFRHLRPINDHRRALTRFYLAEGRTRGWSLLSSISEDLPLQKFPLFTKNADRIRRSLKRQNIHLDDGWTTCVVCPPSADPLLAAYDPQSDPEAEAACEKILTLPTHPTMTLSQARRLTEILDPLL